MFTCFISCKSYAHVLITKKREKERKKDRQTDRKKDRYKFRKIERQKFRKIERQKNRKIEKQKDRKIERQKNRKIERQKSEKNFPAFLFNYASSGWLNKPIKRRSLSFMCNIHFKVSNFCFLKTAYKIVSTPNPHKKIV